jgi:signal transduction histidine kinase
MIVLIKDTGRGITQADQRKIFEPGFTSKSRGWGLGLSLAKRIIEEYHGGKLTLEQSIPGEGTTFKILLPLA